MQKVLLLAAVASLAACGGTSLPASSLVSTIMESHKPSPQPSHHKGDTYLYEDWSSYTPGTTYTDGDYIDTSTYNWTDQFNGPGTTEVFSAGTLITTDYLLEAPQYTSDGNTFASLVTSQDSFTNANFYAYSTFATLSQNWSSPHPYQVGWFVWDYTSNTSFYNVILKSNGWEFDQENTAYTGNQRFIQSGTSPTFAVGSANTIAVSQSGDTFTIKVNGTTLTTYTDTTHLLTGGKIGLYCEDSHVAWGVTAASSN